MKIKILDIENDDAFGELINLKSEKGPAKVSTANKVVNKIKKSLIKVFPTHIYIVYS